MQKDITIALMTCGEETESDCLKSIKCFRSEVDFIEIRNVFPQIKALNKMIDEVKTEWFIPLDADMILHEDAWARIINALNRHRNNQQWHSILFPLWDTLTERKILALKILRSKIAKENPFVDSNTPDVEHYQRLTDLGYTCIDDYLKQKPIGNHVVKGKYFCYFKFKDVYQTYRSYNFEWDSGVFMGGEDLRSKAKKHFDFFLYKFITTNNKDYLYCIAGMIDGIISPLEKKSKTLELKKIKIKSKFAIDEFYRWYMEPMDREGSAIMLF